MITKVNIKLHRYVGLYMSELYLLWNIYVNIEYRTTYKHVWTCLSDLKFKKILFIGSDFYSHEAGKKILLMRFTPREASWISISNAQWGQTHYEVALKIIISRDIFQNLNFWPQVYGSTQGPRSCLCLLLCNK